MMTLRCSPAISMSQGGTQNFALDAGLQFAGQGYLLAGAFQTSPGFPVGPVVIPLALDFWLIGSVNGANTALYPNTLGALDAQGRATAAFVIPPGVPPSVQSGLAGAPLWHAFAVFDGNGALAASNPVRVMLLP